MRLEETIRKDLTFAVLRLHKMERDTLRVVIGEIPRLNLKAGVEATDAQMEGILRKLIKSEETLLSLTKGERGNPAYINILKSYLPKMLSKDEVAAWIRENINLDDYNPVIKAMKDIMLALKGKVSGNVVREILNG